MEKCTSKGMPSTVTERVFTVGVDFDSDASVCSVDSSSTRNPEFTLLDESESGKLYIINSIQG